MKRYCIRTHTAKGQAEPLLPIHFYSLDLCLTDRNVNRSLLLRAEQREEEGALPAAGSNGYCCGVGGGQ